MCEGKECGDADECMKEERADAEGLKNHFDFAGIFCLDYCAVVSLAYICAGDEDEIDGNDGEHDTPVEIARDDDERGYGN